MRISDWSSDVCSSDLTDGDGQPNPESTACEVYWGQTPVDSRQLLERGQAKLEKLLKDIGGPQNITEDNFPEVRSEEHTSELQSLMRISYAVFCLKQKTKMKSN